MIDIEKVTRQYYSCFVDEDINSFNIKDKISFVETEARREILKGYGCRFSIFTLLFNKHIIVSYSPDKEEDVKKIKEHLKQSNLDDTFKSFHHRVLFEYQNIDLNIDTKNVMILSNQDYKAYEDFFQKNNPNAKDYSWLKEYFTEKTNKKYFSGIYKDDNLVCVSDAPDMPYMEDVIQHTGIVTVESERRRGYAKKVAYFTAKHLLSIGVCPQWETSFYNKASIELAKSIGYKPIGDAYILEE